MGSLKYPATRSSLVRVSQYGVFRFAIWVYPPIYRRAVLLIVQSISAIRQKKEEEIMPRYVVEREFPDGLLIPMDENGARACRAVVESNLSDQVTWIHSYVSTDKKKTFCVYDAPSPEAVRRTANRNKLPVGCVTEVRVLDPYFYK
jgi:hypothetical protein